MRRAIRVVVACALGGLALIALAPSASAEERIRQFAVEATVNPDGSMDVVERITYDFDFEQRHGIYREIPVWDELPDGSRWIHPVTVEGVSMDAGTVPPSIETLATATG